MTEDQEILFEMPKGIRVRDENAREPHAPPGPPAPELAGQDAELEESEQLLEGFDPEARVHRAGKHDEPEAIVVADQPFTTYFRTAAVSPGAHFVYALIALTVTLGVLALAMTWQDGRVIAACAVITPLSITWFYLRFRSWLNRTPYCYRLLTSLGENADNLSQFRVMRWVRGALRALYS